jgi:hypothetical protein
MASPTSIFAVFVITNAPVPVIPNHRTGPRNIAIMAKTNKLLSEVDDCQPASPRSAGDVRSRSHLVGFIQLTATTLALFITIPEISSLTVWNLESAALAALLDGRVVTPAPLPPNTSHPLTELRVYFMEYSEQYSQFNINLPSIKIKSLTESYLQKLHAVRRPAPAKSQGFPPRQAPKLLRSRFASNPHLPTSNTNRTAIKSTRTPQNPTDSGHMVNTIAQYCVRIRMKDLGHRGKENRRGPKYSTSGMRNLNQFDPKSILR